MTQLQAIKIFEESQVRTLWDSEQEEWYFSIIDVVQVLSSHSSYQSARNYWKVLKHRLSDEGNETVTNCNQLKMPAADGKMRLTDVATQEQLFRLIQSIPSPKAEPFKLWMAQVASQRLTKSKILSSPLTKPLPTTSDWATPKHGLTNDLKASKSARRSPMNGKRAA